MRKRRGKRLLLGVLGMLVAHTTGAEPAALDRGRYLLRAGGCESCHTDLKNGGAFLAGGVVMATPLGTFYTPNITPDPDTGIGRWTLAEFRRAMIEGIRPDGSHYYPVFPYRWYTGLMDRDLEDLWAYLRTVEPVRNATPPHDLPFPLQFRSLILFWKLLNFNEGETVSGPIERWQWNRGAYLVNHLGHCGACHTQNILGNFLPFEFLAGSWQIPGSYPAPNITPHPEAGIGAWSQEDIIRSLKQAIRPDGTPIRGLMAEYVYSGSSFLTDADLAAIATYLRSLPRESDRVPAAEPTFSTPPPHGHDSAVKSLMRSAGNRTLAK